MFKIVRIPPKIKTFFGSLTTHFHWNHFEYFQALVFLIAYAWGRRNVSQLYRFLDVEQHRTRFNNFMLSRRFNLLKLLRQKAYELLEALRLKAGTVIYLILDDSTRRKHGKRMEAVGNIRDSLTGCIVKGHQYVIAVLRVGDYTIPFGVELYVKQEQCPGLGLPFRKTTEMAAELIRAFEAPKGVKVVVLFDNFYLCPKVKQACEQKGFHYVSTLKDNRNLHKNGRKLKTGTYKKNRFRRGLREVLTLGNGEQLTYVDADWIDVHGLRPLHVVLSRKRKDQRILAVVTDDPDMTADEILRTYGNRWWIEVFFKDAKQLLGLGQYQNRPYRAAVIHLHLVCFAHALLTHLRIERAADEKGKRKCKAARMSTGQAQNELRFIVWKDMVEHLEGFQSGESVVKELQRLQIAC
jgi:SRSO17 transposase